MVFKKIKIRREKKVLKKKWFLGFFPLELLDGLKRQQILSIGSLLMFILLIFPIALWLSYRPESVQNPLIALAKFNAFMAISTLSLNFILATRLMFFEKLFHGLDRMYRVHKIVGRTSLFFIVLHPIFLIINRFPNWDVIITYIVPIGKLDVAAGVIAVYIFLLLLVFTVAINLPYHFWHNSHKLLGIVLLLAGLHALFAGSDINNFLLLRAWIILICGFGVAAWLYMLLFYKSVGPRYHVTLENVVHLHDITELYFKCPQKFQYQPGQYLFIRFPKFEGNKELFPFSISQDPSQKELRVSIKRSGDFTSKKVPLLRKGDRAIIMGPYGKFGERYLKHDKDMVWIAGGIGITPFLSLVKHESLYPTGRIIHLIWVVKDFNDAFHDPELHEETQRNTNFKYVHWLSRKQGRISINDVVAMVGGKTELKKRLIFMCGPPGLTYSLCRGLHKLGVPFRHIIFEDFNMLD